MNSLSTLLTRNLHDVFGEDLIDGRAPTRGVAIENVWEEEL
jgi:hypothetical protein